MKIEYTTQFKREYKKYHKKHYPVERIETAIDAIVNDNQLVLQRMKNHSLVGNWNGFNELHLQSNWLMIYRIDNNRVILTLTRLGTHQSLFLI
ncbi:type II toxin-antitoxin system YafQ family toxin [Fructilactobacillus sp. Tb1]|uniref:type II toxin-antitoxin system YafQ family toxin n=1 Tax=Fructilactobacillus sp. Tb1 TaxID=3422304 RepID=UPI003D2D0EC8